ncbi:GAF and ANTAR domain-containing protein [Salinifilum ghardaiensis]
MLTPVTDGNDHDPRRGLVHTTNDVSAGLEDLQLTVGEGPCLDAFTTGGPVFIADLASATVRWPGFTPAAQARGAAAVFSFPLHIGVIRVGSLDFYRDTPGSLSAAQTADGVILAELATHTILGELEGRSSADASWLADPHAEVHQATGMVQVQLETTSATALLRLRAHAYTHELSLTEVARQVTTRQLRFSPDEDP